MLITIIPYSQIVSLVLEKYIKNNQQYFTCNDKTYILTSKFKINLIQSAIADTIEQVISRCSPSNIYVVGECYSFNNWRVTSAYNVVNPSYKQMLDGHSTIKYILKEENIKIDDLKINHICDVYFNKHFKNPIDNIKFLKHRNLTEDDLIYIFTQLFSRKNLNIIEDNTILNKVNNLIYNISQDQIPEKYIKIISSLIEQQFNCQ